MRPQYNLVPNYSGIFLKRLFEIMEENVGQINLAFEACTSDDNTTKFDQGMFFSSKYRRTLPFAFLYIVFLTLNRNTMVSFKLFKSFVCKEQKKFFYRQNYFLTNFSASLADALFANYSNKINQYLIFKIKTFSAKLCSCKVIKAGVCNLQLALSILSLTQVVNRTDLPS